MKRAYERWNPRGATQALIDAAVEICADYATQGYDLTLRQLYYQFVARGLIPNTEKSYNQVGMVVDRARKAGLLDWSYIVDRTRNLQDLSHWNSPVDIIRGAARGFAIDKWQDQDLRIEVWVEKEALAGVVERAAEAYDCAWFSCRGYVSQSEMWKAAQRIGSYIANGQRVVILHLGDHDPSGIDMSRDIDDRLTNYLTMDWMLDQMGSRKASMRTINDDMAARCDTDKPAFYTNRIALNMDQVEQYNPPPNPGKVTDSRFRDYQELYGDDSWELDALDPATLNALITDHIEQLVDYEKWDEARAEEERMRSQLSRVAAHWTTAVTLLDRYVDGDERHPDAGS